MTTVLILPGERTERREACLKVKVCKGHMSFPTDYA